MKPTAHDAAAVSDETQHSVADLELIASYFGTQVGKVEYIHALNRAIDRLIILDNAAQARQPVTDPRVIKFTDAEARALLEDSAS